MRYDSFCFLCPSWVAVGSLANVYPVGSQFVSSGGHYSKYPSGGRRRRQYHVETSALRFRRRRRTGSIGRVWPPAGTAPAGPVTRRSGPLRAEMSCGSTAGGGGEEMGGAGVRPNRCRLVDCLGRRLDGCGRGHGVLWLSADAFGLTVTAAAIVQLTAKSPRTGPRQFH